MQSRKLRKKVLPVAMAGLMVLSCMPAMAAEDPWSVADAKTESITITMDGKELKVTHYNDHYTDKTAEMDKTVTGAIYGQPATYNQWENALVDVWVPEGVELTDDVPVLYKVENGGWMANTYESSIQFENGGAYTSDDGIAMKALSEGCIVVNAGLRTRGMTDEAGNVNHSGVTVADAKAVIKWLKHNDIGNPDRIIITGTSGGGALSSAVGASGNSADYDDDFEAIGACVDSTDDIFGVIAYCPITDLGKADGAYEFTYAGTRQDMIDDGFSNRTILGEVTMDISPVLAEAWAEYVNDLGLVNEDGKALTAAFDAETLTSSGTIYDGMKDLLIASIQAGLDSVDGDADALFAIMNERTEAAGRDGSKTYGDGTAAEGWNDCATWVTVENGKVTDIDMDACMYYVALGQGLKIAPAFTSEGTSVASQSENNLFGNPDEVYGFLMEEVWDLEAGGAAGVLHAKYGSWDEYWAQNGDMLEKQERMVNSISYLTSDDGDSAPYWWVRHGSVDRDTSFANQTLLYYSLANDSTIEDYNFAFAFNKPHTGDYSVESAWAWMEANIESADESEVAPDWSIEDAVITELTYKIDGMDVDVARLTDYYLANTGDLTAEAYENAKVNVYVPEGATENSPVLYMVNNSGWRSNSYSDTLLEEGVDISSADKGNMAAMALKNGVIVVDAGLRSRGSVDSEGNYNHSPVTVADAKAVIKYLRFNEIGDTDKIFITGTSGGGALSAAIGASGNSADFYEELYTIGAAGMTDAKTSTIKDDVYGVIAYCPITDLAHSDGSYEFTYAGARLDLLDAGLIANDKATTFALSEDTMRLSPALAADWAVYVNAMNLKNEAGDPLTAAFDAATLTSSGTLYDGMLDLAVACFQEALDELGYEEFIAQLKSRAVALDDPATTEGRNAVEGYYGSVADDDAWQTDWLTFSADKKTIEAIDAEGYLYYVAAGQVLKPAVAFTNQGVPCFDGLMYNENNLFGQPDEEYGYNLEIVFNESSLKDVYGSWDAYWKANGDLITLQGKMIDSIAYLTDAEGESDAAPYWYVRHGSNDRDTGFANQTLLYYALLNNQTIETIDFEFEFGLGHTGGYGVPEVEQFMLKSLDGEGYRPVINDGDADNDGVKDEDEKSPTTGEASALPMMMVVVVAAAGVAFATRRRVVR